jgi:Uma2 family endonuclease
MSSIYLPPPTDTELPDHTQLPETDGSIVENFQEFPLGMLLTDSLRPVINVLHPDGRYAIGCDSGIYWRNVKEEPLRGCKSPDWFYVPGVAPMPPGMYRRSYVMWNEHVPPQLILEIVSGDGSEERDATPEKGKFWVYEQAIRAAYYGIFESESSSLEMYQLVGNRYRRLAPNAHGRYFIPALGVELGIWYGVYADMTMPWLRWWDSDGTLLKGGWEAEEQERLAKERECSAKKKAERLAERERLAKEQTEQRAELERSAKERAEQRAEQERSAKEQERLAKEQAEQRAEQLAAKLRALGIDPEA